MISQIEQEHRPTHNCQLSIINCQFGELWTSDGGVNREGFDGRIFGYVNVLC